MPETTYKVDYQRVKKEITFEQVLGFVNVQLRRLNDTQFRGDCPLCAGSRTLGVSERTDKYPDGVFNCFHCKSSGDKIEFVSRVRGNGRKSKEGCHQAARDLQERFLTVGTVPPTQGTVRSVRTVRTVPDADHAAQLERIRARLESDHEGVQKLGISTETAKLFDSGYNGSGDQRGRYSVALHSTNGDLVGFAGIAVGDEQPQMVLGKGVDPLLIFNAHRIDGADVVIAKSVLELIKQVEDGWPIESIVAPLMLPTSAEWLEVLAAFLADRKVDSLWF